MENKDVLAADGNDGIEKTDIFKTASIQYAGFWKRLVADLIDSFVLSISSLLVVLMILGCFYWIGLFFEKTAGGSLFEGFSAFLVQIVLVVVRFLSSLIYYTWGTYRYGTTLGKRCFRIYVVNMSDRSGITLQQSLVRFMGYALSYIPLCAGFLMIAFQREKRGLHDFIAGTVSIIKPKKLITQEEV